MTFQTVIELPMSRDTIEAVGDLDKMHKSVMKLFPNLSGMNFDAEARELMGIVYRVDVDNSRPLDPKVRVTVNSAVEVEGGHSTSVVPLFEEGDTVILSSKLRSEKRSVKGRESGQKNSEANRRTRMVRDDEFGEWIDALFSENGMEVSEVAAGRASQVGFRGGIRGYAREVRVSVKVIDAEKANIAIHRGIGRGKAYGFGLLQVIEGA